MSFAGAGMVLLGGFAVYWEYSRTQRRLLNLISDLAAALDQLAGEVRWKLTPLPDAIFRLTDRKTAGQYFQKIEEELKSGTTLQKAWEQVFRELPDECSSILLRMEWGGDVSRQEGNILYAAAQLQELFGEKQRQIRQKEKLCAATALSAAGLLVLILV